MQLNSHLLGRGWGVASGDRERVGWGWGWRWWQTGVPENQTTTTAATTTGTAKPVCKTNDSQSENCRYHIFAVILNYPSPRAALVINSVDHRMQCLQPIYIEVYWTLRRGGGGGHGGSGGIFLACEDFMKMFDHSFPACAL